MKRLLVTILIGAIPVVAPAAETKIGPRGQVIVNGRPTIPLAVWTQPTYLFEYYRHLGMNCIVSAISERGDFQDVKSALDAASESNLGLVLPSWRGRALPNHAVVWGHLGGVAFPNEGGGLARDYADVHRREPNHFVMINIPIHEFLRGQDPNFFTKALLSADAVISHVWPECDEPNRPDLRNVAKFVDLVRKYCKDRPGGEVSIWPDINPHSWTLKKAEGGRSFDAPRPEELRFEIWLALIHGADGICIFPISFEPMFVYSQIPARNEQELAWNARLIGRMTHALTAEESTLKAEVAGDRRDGILDWTTRTVDGKHYIFLLNGGRQEQTVTLRAPGLGSQWRVRDAIKDVAAPAADGTISERLPGLALRIWELAPAAASQPASAPAR